MSKERGLFQAELSQKTINAEGGQRGEGSGNWVYEKRWKDLEVHIPFRERYLASAALKDPVMQVWGVEGPSWESTQVETIRGIIWAESSWRRLGGLCSVGGGLIGIIAPNFCCFLTQQ